MLTVHMLNDRICAHSHNAAHATEVLPNDIAARVGQVSPSRSRRGRLDGQRARP